MLNAISFLFSCTLHLNIIFPMIQNKLFQSSNAFKLTKGVKNFINHMDSTYT